jgi:hypothetical protein
MSHQIMMGGKPLDPKRAAKNLMPLDTLLICPECESDKVCAGEAKTVARIGHEYKDGIPRMQTRRCLACEHRWEVVLPPMSYQHTQSLIIPGRGR